MVKKKLYLNTSLQQKRYTTIRKTIYQNKELLNDMKELNISNDDVNLYLSYKFYESTDALNYYYENMLKENTDLSKHQNSNRILEHIYKELLKPLQTIYKYRDLHNDFFKKIQCDSIKDNNPFLLNNKMIEYEFDITKNSAIEVYTKNMLWTSRIAKESEIIRKNIIFQTCPPNSKEADIVNCGKAYHSAYKDVLKDKSKWALLETFLTDYSSYIYGDIPSKRELKQRNSYKKVKAILKKSPAFQEFNITPEQFYKYASCEITQERLYDLKHYCIDLIVQKYSELSKKENNNIKIYSTVDERRKHKSYNSSFNVSLPKYNTDFMVHVDSKYLKDLTLKYGTEISCKNLEMPFKPYMVYKPTNTQKKQINHLATNNNDISIKKIVEYEYNRIYENLSRGEDYVK